MKPKYSLRKNFSYAIDGFFYLLKENAFRIELFFFFFFTLLLIYIDIPSWGKLFLFTSLFIPLFAESFNTAIEKTVDLASEDYHELAKAAKDIAAFGVLISVVFTGCLWLGFFVYFGIIVI
jgi:diacylglycerol kinase (ATP)